MRLLRKYLRWAAIVLGICLLIAYLIMNFGGGLGAGSGSGEQGKGDAPVSTSSTPQADTLPTPAVAVQEAKTDTLPTPASPEKAVFSQIRVIKKDGVVVVLLDGKPRSDWKQAVRASFDGDRASLFFSVAGNVSYADAQAVKDYLLSEKIDFVD